MTSDTPSQEFEGTLPASEEAIASVELRLGRALPLPYREFLLRSNGGVGFAGDLYLILWRVEELIKLNADYEVQDAAPGFFIFGSNGGGEAFAFDLTKPDFRVYMLPFITMEPEDGEADPFPLRRARTPPNSAIRLGHARDGDPSHSVMSIQHIDGAEDVTSAAVLDRVLTRRTEDEANHFWICAADADFPALSVHVNGDLAHLNFIPSEDEAGLTSSGNECGLSDGLMTLRSNGDSIDVPTYTLVPWAKAELAIRQFVNEGTLIGSITWRRI